MKRLPSKRAFALLLLPALLATTPFSAPAQRTPPPGAGAQGGGLPALLVNVVVSVRETGGMPLQGSAFVKLSSDFSGVHLTAPTRDGGAATFASIRAGDYQIEVSSAGYKTTTEQASILPSFSSFNVYVYIAPESAPGAGNAPPGGTIMTPHLQSEIDKGLDKMRHQQFDAARSHFDKAAKIAPSNPDVQYLLGMLEYYQQHYDLARPKLEAAIAIYPSHERALVTLGEIELRTGQASLAARTLEKAYLVNGADWHTHYLLAFAYAELKEFDKARPHAQRAAELARTAVLPQGSCSAGSLPPRINSRRPEKYSTACCGISQTTPLQTTPKLRLGRSTDRSQLLRLRPYRMRSRRSHRQQPIPYPSLCLRPLFDLGRRLTWMPKSTWSLRM
jgi:tetratricopeptide repeat protein